MDAYTRKRSPNNRSSIAHFILIVMLDSDYRFDNGNKNKYQQLQPDTKQTETPANGNEK